MYNETYTRKYRVVFIDSLALRSNPMVSFMDRPIQAFPNGQLWVVPSLRTGTLSYPQLARLVETGGVLRPYGQP